LPFKLVLKYLQRKTIDYRISHFSEPREVAENEELKMP
jgi:hypothetical protein